MTTIEGLDPPRERIAAAFVATGGSQCGFCTPGHRDARVGLEGSRSRPRAGRAPVPLHRLAHRLRRARAEAGAAGTRDLDAAARRAELEGGVQQTVRADIPLGGALRRRHRAARRARRGSVAARFGCRFRRRGRRQWVIGASLAEARLAAGKVQGRRTTAEERPPLFDALPDVPAGACASRRRGSSPRTSSPTRRGARRAVRRRRRTRTAARSAARSGRPRRARASSPSVSARWFASSTRAKTSCASGRSVHRSRRPRGSTTGVSRSTASSRAAARRSSSVADAVLVFGRRAGAKSTWWVLRSAERVARRRSGRASGARGRRARRGRHRPRVAHR